MSSGDGNLSSPSRVLAETDESLRPVRIFLVRSPWRVVGQVRVVEYIAHKTNNF